MSAPGRPAHKQEAILAWLRQRMLEGGLRPGDRLPTRSELKRRFRAGPDTVQRALDRLAREGFVEARGRHGTFVAARPPHLHRYALVTYFADDPRWHRTGWLSRVILQEARAGRWPDRSFECYFSVNGHADSEDSGRLIADMRAGRLAGLIFLESPHAVYDTPIVQMPGVPRVGVMSRSPFDIPAVYPDEASFFDRAVAYLAKRGRRRIATINTITGGPTEQLTSEAHAAAALRARGLEVRPYWLQAIHPAVAHRARQIVHLLMHGPAHDRPDGLIIGGDALVEAATQGLHDAGVRVPDEVEVVGHCNFPLLPSAVTPVRRLGFSATRLLERCCAAVDAQRRGETPAPGVGIPAVFDDELPPDALPDDPSSGLTSIPEAPHPSPATSLSERSLP